MLPHFLPALFLILFLHPLPLSQNILYLHLACDLLLHRCALRHHKANLAIRLLREDPCQLSGGLYGHSLLPLLSGSLLPHLFHDLISDLIRCRIFLL